MKFGISIIYKSLIWIFLCPTS